MRVSDTDSAVVTLDDGQSVSEQHEDGHLELDTSSCDEIRIYIDDGTTGVEPASYDLQIDKYVAVDIDDWMYDDNYTDEVARSWSLPSPSARTRIDITNVSGIAGATYRIYTETRRDS